MGLGGLLCLGTEVGGSGSTGEIPGKDWLEEGMEDELCAAKWFDGYELEGWTCNEIGLTYTHMYRYI